MTQYWNIEDKGIQDEIEAKKSINRDSIWQKKEEEVLTEQR